MRWAQPSEARPVGAERDVHVGRPGHAHVHAQRVAGEAEQLRDRVSSFEEALHQAERERDDLRGTLERLEGERQAAGEAARSVEETLAGTQRELEAAREEERRATTEAGELRARVASLEKLVMMPFEMEPLGTMMTLLSGVFMMVLKI